MSRHDHEFYFTADVIARAANDEAEYHDERLVHWLGRREKALQIVKETVSAKVIEQDITGGKQAAVVVDYGDAEAWKEYQLAYKKVVDHQRALDEFLTESKLYETQGSTTYELNADDVHYFRLGGQARPE